MDTTASVAEAFPPPRRSWLPAGALQGLTWLLVIALILGPVIPLFDASLRDRPLYEPQGVVHAFCHAV